MIAVYTQYVQILILQFNDIRASCVRGATASGVQTVQAPTMPPAEDKASGKGLRSKHKPCNPRATNPSLTLDAMTIARPTPLSCVCGLEPSPLEGRVPQRMHKYINKADDDDDHVFDEYYDDDGGDYGICAIWSEPCISGKSEFI